MMLKTRIRLKLGDVFSVPIDAASKKFFQYVADDRSLLNSTVVRAFQKTYASDELADPNEVVRGAVEFYAHVVIKWGTEMGLWEKVGNASELGRLDVLFRDTNDVGHPEIKTSRNWYVWKVNEEFQRVGELKGELRKAEIGLVVSPPNIVHRMRTGEYRFVYPGY
jgi:hypothetical protein